MPGHVGVPPEAEEDHALKDPSPNSNHGTPRGGQVTIMPQLTMGTGHQVTDMEAALEELD